MQGGRAEGVQAHVQGVAGHPRLRLLLASRPLMRQPPRARSKPPAGHGQGYGAYRAGLVRGGPTGTLNEWLRGSGRARGRGAPLVEGHVRALVVAEALAGEVGHGEVRRVAWRAVAAYAAEEDRLEAILDPTPRRQSPAEARTGVEVAGVVPPLGQHVVGASSWGRRTGRARGA